MLAQGNQNLVSYKLIYVRRADVTQIGPEATKVRVRVEGILKKSFFF